MAFDPYLQRSVGSLLPAIQLLLSILLCLKGVRSIVTSVYVCPSVCRLYILCALRVAWLGPPCVLPVLWITSCFTQWALGHLRTLIGNPTSRVDRHHERASQMTVNTDGGRRQVLSTLDRRLSLV